jgi:hypothetical protein
MAGLSKQAPTSTAPTTSTGGPAAGDTTQSTAQGTDTALTGATPAVAQARGNDAAQAQIAGGGGDAGLANYESALGEFLGKELYKAVSGALEFSKIQGYGHSAMDAAIKAAVSKLGGWDKIKADPGALDGLVGILQSELDPVVDKWLAGEGGKDLQKHLAGWAGAHPRTIALTALLAAAGAVFANVDIPTLKQSFGIGENVKGEVEADLGKIRSIALKKIRAKLSYTSGPLMAAVEVNHAQGGDTTADVTAKLGSDDHQVSVNGTFDKDGLKVAGLHGVLASGDKTKVTAGTDFTRGGDTLTKLSLVTKDGDRTTTDDFQYDHTNGTLTLGKSALTMLGDGSSYRQSVKGSTDGNQELGLGFTKAGKTGSTTLDYTHIENAYSLSHEDRVKLGFNYKKDDLNAMLDAAFTQKDGKSSGSVSGKVDTKFGDHMIAGADLTAQFGDSKSLEVGAFYGFQNKEEFKSYLLSYRMKTQTSEQQFGLTAERKLNDIYFRYQQSVVLGTDGNKMESQLHAGKFINTDTAIVGGIDYTKNFTTGQNSFRPEVGVQHKGVQVLFGYDVDNKAGTIRLGIPF